MAGQSDWEAPVQEGRFPLAVNYKLINYPFCFHQLFLRCNCIMNKLSAAIFVRRDIQD